MASIKGVISFLSFSFFLSPWTTFLPEGVAPHRQPISAGVDGRPSGVSCLRRYGSEDPNNYNFLLESLKLVIKENFMLTLAFLHLKWLISLTSIYHHVGRHVACVVCMTVHYTKHIQYIGKHWTVKYRVSHRKVVFLLMCLPFRKWDFLRKTFNFCYCFSGVFFAHWAIGNIFFQLHLRKKLNHS